jgi:hypothetical protein
MSIGEGLYTPIILPVPPSANTLAIFHACGMIMRIGLLWKEDYLPFSPFLLMFMIGGFDAAVNIDFVKAVAPELAKRLETWPPSPQHPLAPGLDPMNLIIDHIPNMQARNYFTPSYHTYDKIYRLIMFAKCLLKQWTR